MPVIQIPLASNSDFLSTNQITPANIILHERGWNQYRADSPGGWLSIKSFSAGMLIIQSGEADL